LCAVGARSCALSARDTTGVAAIVLQSSPLTIVLYAAATRKPGNRPPRRQCCSRRATASRGLTTGSEPIQTTRTVCVPTNSATTAVNVFTFAPCDNKAAQRETLGPAAESATRAMLKSSRNGLKWRVEPQSQLPRDCSAFERRPESQPQRLVRIGASPFFKFTQLAPRYEPRSCRLHLLA
jgi:hypothetical protein